MRQKTLKIARLPILALFLVCAYYVFTFPRPAQAAPASAQAVEMNNKAIALAKKGKFVNAVSLLRKAASLDPSAPEIRRNLSQTLTDYASQLQTQGKSANAKPLLQEAVQIDSMNGPAWLILGDILYLRESRLEEALSAWQKALAAAPSDKRSLVIDRMNKAKLDQSVERGFAQTSTEHFLIRFRQGFNPEAVAQLGLFMEERYALLATELNVNPQKITLIIYPLGSFERLNRRSDWAVGMYDGRIRMREDDIGSAHEKTILSHELAHAFLHEGFGGSIPAWIHEGYAQLKEFEPASSVTDQELENALESRNQWIPVKWLDKHFAQPDSDTDVDRAYIEARMAVRRLLERYGAEKFSLFIRKISSGMPVDKAFNEAFRPARFSRFSAGIFE